MFSKTKFEPTSTKPHILKMTPRFATLTLNGPDPYSRSNIDQCLSKVRMDEPIITLKLLARCDSDATFQYLIDRLPQLQTLHLCHIIPHPSNLLTIIPRMKHILYDDIRSSEFLQQTLVRLTPKVETLALRSCDGLDHIYDLVPYIQHLKTLSIDGCKFSTAVAADVLRALPKLPLESLRLVHQFNQELPILALILALPTSHIKSLAIWHSFQPHQMIQFLHALTLSPVVELELFDMNNLDPIAEWLRTDNKMEVLHLPPDSTAWSKMDVRYHPRLKEVPVTPVHRPLGMVGQRVFVNQSQEVRRFIPLLAQPPVPKDIIRHIHGFCRIRTQKWMGVEEVFGQMLQHLPQHPELMAQFDMDL